MSETASTTQIIHEPDHAARAIASDLPSQFRELPRWQAFASALGHGAQCVEDDAFALHVAFLLDLATGHMLDRWGLIVGEPRGGLGDNTYRRFISARLMVNRSDRSLDSLIEIYRVLMRPLALRTDGQEMVRGWTLPPLHVRLEAVRHAFLERAIFRRVARTMEAARPAGVSFALIEAVVGYYGFADDDYSLGYDDGGFARRIDL